MRTRCKEDIVMALKIIAPDSVDKFLANFKNQNAAALDEAFLWSNTKEGHDYWSDLNTRIYYLNFDRVPPIIGNTKFKVGDSVLVVKNSLGSVQVEAYVGKCGTILEFIKEARLEPKHRNRSTWQEYKIGFDDYRELWVTEEDIELDDVL